MNTEDAQTLMEQNKAMMAMLTKMSTDQEESKKLLHTTRQDITREMQAHTERIDSVCLDLSALSSRMTALESGSTTANASLRRMNKKGN